MSVLSLESLAAPVRAFFDSLPSDDSDTVLIVDGQPAFHIRNARLVATPSWTPEMNARRFELIDREFDSGLTETEAQELEELQIAFRRYRRQMTPLPIGETNQLLEKLERLAGSP